MHADDDANYHQAFYNQPELWNKAFNQLKASYIHLYKTETALLTLIEKNKSTQSNSPDWIWLHSPAMTKAGGQFC